tara:strand:+ start:4248 stop:4604 length:357 start_codon:yes stop_codon:yes gene_type:complete
MVNLLVDEAFAFDYIAILKLKADKGYISEESIEQNFNHLREQIGSDLFDTIINSNQFKKLYDANSVTFDAVDAAKEDKMLASEVDKTNYFRMLAKTELQKHFFETDLQEVKIGYERLK